MTWTWDLHLFIIQEDSWHSSWKEKKIRVISTHLPSTKVIEAFLKNHFILFFRRYYPNEVLYWKGVSQENNRLLNKIFRIDKVIVNVKCNCVENKSQNWFEGETNWEEARDNVRQIQVPIFITRKVVFFGELQHLLCWIWKKMWLEEEERENKCWGLKLLFFPMIMTHWPSLGRGGIWRPWHRKYH